MLNKDYFFIIKLHHLDHIYSCIDAYNNNIHPFIVAHLCNIRFIYWMENLNKSGSSDKTIETLIQEICNFHKESFYCVRYPLNNFKENLIKFGHEEDIKFLL